MPKAFRTAMDEESFIIWFIFEAKHFFRPLTLKLSGAKGVRLERQVRPWRRDRMP
jgi:hypothetical protein